MIRIEKEAGRFDLAPQLVEILDDVYGQSPWTLEQVLADIGQPQNWYALAYSGEALVGFLARDCSSAIRNPSSGERGLFRGERRKHSGSDSLSETRI